jgi:penicillin-binding protein 1C
MLSNAQLPAPLRRFGRQEKTDARGVRLAFPPDGARLARLNGGVPIKLRDGTPPYTILANGAVLATGLRRTEFQLPFDAEGFSVLSVIDARGQSDRVQIEIK